MRAVALPDGSAVYVVSTGQFGNTGAETVSVIDTASDAVKDTIPVGDNPGRPAVLPDGTAVYVANKGDDTVSVIARPDR